MKTVMNRIRRLLPLLLTVLASACSVRQEIDLSLDGSGTAALDVRLHPVFISYYKDLASGFDGNFDPEHPKIFDLPAIRKNFSAEGGVELVKLEAPEPGRLKAEMRFKEISALVKSRDPKIREALAVSRKDTRETLRIRLDGRNVAAMLKITPEGDSKIAKMLLPPEGKTLSEEEYLEHLSWALEDYAGNENIKTILRDSAVDLRVKVQGRIVEQHGGTVEGSSAVVYSVSLLKLFSLKRPLEYSLTYERLK